MNYYVKQASMLLRDAMTDIGCERYYDAHVRLELALTYARQLDGTVIVNRVRRAFIAQAMTALKEKGLTNEA